MEHLVTLWNSLPLVLQVGLKIAAILLPLLGMVAYFTGVVRAPLTAVIIISETTVSRGLMLPMLGAALIADQASQWVCRDRLYHALSATFATRET